MKVYNKLTGKPVNCSECGRELFDKETKPCTHCIGVESEMSLNMSRVL